MDLGSSPRHMREREKHVASPPYRYDRRVGFRSIVKTMSEMQPRGTLFMNQKARIKDIDETDHMPGAHVVVTCSESKGWR